MDLRLASKVPFLLSAFILQAIRTTYDQFQFALLDSSSLLIGRISQGFELHHIGVYRSRPREYLFTANGCQDSSVIQ